jgi:hypothetical protein
MARILDNPYGGRRMIRLSSEDIMMVVSMFQQEFRNAAPTYSDVEQFLTSRPFYLPEEAL